MHPQPARADSFRGDRRHSRSAQLAFEAKVDAKGGALWIQAAVIDWLNSPRRPGESYSDVILRPR